MALETKTNSASLTSNKNKLIYVEGNRNSARSPKQDIHNLFDEISDVIIEEKGHISEDEIQLLVGMLRNKVNKLQNTNKNNDIPSEELLFCGTTNIVPEPDDTNNEKTMKALEVITDKMSNYIIQEKGEIIEQDILELADQLRQFSSITIANKNCYNTDHVVLKTDSLSHNTCVSTVSIKKQKQLTTVTNVNSEKNIELKNKLDASYFSCIDFNEIFHKNNSDDESCDHSKYEMAAEGNSVNLKRKESILSLSSKNTDLSNSDETSSYLQNNGSLHNVPSFLRGRKNEDQINMSKQYNEQIIPCPATKVKFVNHKSCINKFNYANTDEEKAKHFDSQLTDKQEEDVLLNNKKVRHRWESGKNKQIFLKTTNYLNSFISIKDKDNIQQENIEDKYGKISLLFNKVVDVIMEKFSVQEKDIEEMANMLKQNQGRQNIQNLEKEFITVTPDMPRWALRGFLNNSNGLTSIAKSVSCLLNKMAEYIIHEQGQILHSDITKFCAILGRKLMNQIQPKEISSTTGVPETDKVNVKARKSEIRVSSAKYHQPQTLNNFIKRDEYKKTYLSQNKGILLPTPVDFKKHNDSKQRLSIDAAIQEGIRSLEYIKQLSERLLSDLDEKSGIKNETEKKIIPMKISQNLVMKQLLQCQASDKCREHEDENGKCFEKNSQGILNDSSFAIKNCHKTICCDRYPKFKPAQGDKIREVKKDTSKVSILNNINGQKIDRVSKFQPKHGESSNEDKKNKESQNIKKERTETLISKQNNSDPLLRCKTDIKKCIKATPRSVSKPLELNDYHTFTSDTGNKFLKQQNTFTILNKNDYSLNKQDNTSENITGQLTFGSHKNDEDKLKRASSQEVILKVSKTYSVFKPFLTDKKKISDEISNSSCQSAIMHQEKNGSHLLKRNINSVNNARGKSFESKIPVRTIYVTRGRSFSVNK